MTNDTATSSTLPPIITKECTISNYQKSQPKEIAHSLIGKNIKNKTITYLNENTYVNAKDQNMSKKHKIIIPCEVSEFEENYNQTAPRCIEEINEKERFQIQENEFLKKELDFKLHIRRPIHETYLTNSILTEKNLEYHNKIKKKLLIEQQNQGGVSPYQEN
ncbi:UNKNOWN [Stylonychia lemnae]|uniref:Uncharacterized protein n=1 Tax=Stylonychia lemnae TaxID=5949 RepID=A0A078ARR5_STYLE|nr:UNKNOWN [Stylonychia lemnae]|eukprot:CDW83563.1 UNKNOWN [Stylonychia lemnae]